MRSCESLSRIGRLRRHRRGCRFSLSPIFDVQECVCVCVWNLCADCPAIETISFIVISICNLNSSDTSNQNLKHLSIFFSVVFFHYFFSVHSVSVSLSLSWLVLFIFGRVSLSMDADNFPAKIKRYFVSCNFSS